MKLGIIFLLILLGFFLLFIVGLIIPAGVCFLLGIVMIMEKMWPEEWKADKRNPTEK